jgi:AraC-like DNA-binding protein
MASCYHFLSMKEKLNLPPGAHGAVWFYQASQSEVRPMHRHRETELNLVTAGRASYVLGDRRYELLADDLVWLFPAQEHQLIDRSADYEMWIAVFAPAALHAAVRGTPAAVLAEKTPEGRFCKSLSRADALALGRLFAELHGTTGQARLFNAGLRYLALRSWERFAGASDGPAYHTLHPAVENALRLLRRGESEESLKQLSQKAGLSPARLSRQFKIQVGMGIAEYRSRARLGRFLDLYREGRPITALAAAFEAGFQSYAQFHRVFRRLMGESPADFRRKMRR